MTDKELSEAAKRHVNKAIVLYRQAAEAADFPLWRDNYLREAARLEGVDVRDPAENCDLDLPIEAGR